MDVLRQLKSKMVLQGMTVDSLSVAMGYHKKTMYRKLKNSGKLTLDEMKKLAEILKIENPTDIFFDVK